MESKKFLTKMELLAYTEALIILGFQEIKKKNYSGIQWKKQGEDE